MTKALCVVALLASIASADSRTCKPSGDVVFQLDQRADKGVKLATAKTRVYKNGAYITQSYDRYNTLTSTDAGCLPATADALLEFLAEPANYKTSPIELPCKETSPRFTEIRASGKLVLVDRRCNRVDVTREARAAIAELVFTARIPLVDDVRRTVRRQSRAPDSCEGNPLAKGCH